MFMCEIRHLFPRFPLSLMVKMVFLDCLKNEFGSQGIFLHIPMGEHLKHRYAKNKKKNPSWRFLLHPDLKCRY